MTTKPLELLCPQCRSSMPWTSTSPLACSSCTASYSVEDGIPIIRKTADYYHELLSREHMRRLIQRTKEIGWNAALAEHLANEPEGRRSAQQTVFLDESRAAFKAILAPMAGRRVLDLGCGSGITAISLARWAREVVACDLTFERVAFLSLRAQQLGLNNIRPMCAGDTRPLPFVDATFDCIILNGVLEWSAAEGDGPVRAGQIEFLKEVKRVLQPHGQLYIGIENRVGFNYFLGAPEDHTGVKFAALAPRWLADMLVQRAHGHDYRTYTYSATGYRQLLQEAGFPDAHFFSLIPDYRRFREITSLDHPSSQSPPSHLSPRQRIKHRLERSRRFASSYGIVASPHAVEDGWVEQLVRRVASELKIGSGNQFPKVQVSSTSSAGLVITIGNEAIIRAPLDPINEQRVHHNYEGLQHAQTSGLASTDFVAPQPLGMDTFSGALYTVESRLPGKQLATLPPRQRDEAAGRILEALIKLKATDRGSQQIEAEARVWHDHVLSPLEDLLSQLQDERYRNNVARLLQLASSSIRPALPSAFTHGDFWWGNILVDIENSQIGLVDWDRWAPSDIATHDLLHFICYRRVLRDGGTWSDAFAHWLSGQGTDPVEHLGCKNFSETLRVPENWKPWAGLAYWTREATGHHPTKLHTDKHWVDSIIGKVAPVLLARIEHAVSA